MFEVLVGPVLGLFVFLLGSAFGAWAERQEARRERSQETLL